jgi:N-acetylglutamate synthase-like GNAT family acetyltransferase
MPDLENFTTDDLTGLSELQPPDWGDLRPRFQEFIASPRCNPVKFCIDGKMVAVGTTIRHEDTAWLACIIVHQDFRNQGLGKQMTGELMRSLDQNIFKTIYLDATEMGFPVYQNLGFQQEVEYSHFLKKSSVQPQKQVHDIIAFQPEFHYDVLQLDELISGEKRSFILEKNMASAHLIHRNRDLLGFYMPQLGEGLIMAKDTKAGLELMALRAVEKSNAAFPSANKSALDLMPALGFEFYRSSRRMFYGEKRTWNPQSLFNRISGQLG